jgi:hypothetical protein
MLHQNSTYLWQKGEGLENVYVGLENVYVPSDTNLKKNHFLQIANFLKPP